MTENNEEVRTKRKYTKRDYFADLDKKIGIWKSIEEQFNRIHEFYKRREAINLSKMQEEVLNYIMEFDSKEGKLLSSSEEIQKKYAELQELLNREDATATFDLYSNNPSSNLRQMMLEYLIGWYNNLQAGRKEQNQRIQDIQALIKFEKKQLQLEEARKRTEQKKHSKGDRALFKSCMQRIFRLYKRVRQDQAEIKEIQQELRSRAKALIQKANECFPEKVEKECIEGFQMVYSDLEKGLETESLLKRELRNALTSFKQAVIQEKLKLQQAKAVVLPKIPEKTPEEKIQDAFDMALEKEENLVLIGPHRSLGLTNQVIKDINKDEEYKEDIIDHIFGLLKTPQGQDFGKAGNSRWKPVQGSDILYELSINPKVGHRQNMPRLYAQKELFVQTPNTIELTNNKNDNQTENIWVLVKKGSKRSQENDIDMAEKVYFQNDGKPHRGQITVNDLGWQKVDIRPQPTLPQKKLAIAKTLREHE